MPRIVIEPERNNVLARITLIELSPTDGIYTLHCTGGRVDECPTAGFQPGDTWGDGIGDCIAAAEVHMLAHERRRCRECGGENSAPEVVRGPLGEVESRRVCASCGHVEVWS